MSIQTLAVNVGGTSSATGGTSTSMLSKGATLNKREVIFDDSSEFIDQIHATFTVSDPVVRNGSPNGYTQARSGLSIEFPLGLDNGNRTTNTLRINLAVDPETTDAEIDGYLEVGAQMLYLAALRNFWRRQSTD